MLPAPARMRSAEDFRRTVRSGVRVSRPTLVVHAGCNDLACHRVGLVVSKTVGSAVRRNRVKRRLRHLAAERLADTPPGIDVVVRALPRAVSDPMRLPSDFSVAWSTAVSRLDCP